MSMAEQVSAPPTGRLADEIEIAPEMIEAGAEASLLLFDFFDPKVLLRHSVEPCGSLEPRATDAPYSLRDGSALS
jgi:hypothetical protein